MSNRQQPVFGWDEQLAFSHGHSLNEADLERVLRERIPGFVRIRKATPEEDLAGTDFFVQRDHGLSELAFDKKVRAEDWNVKRRGYKDDLALETWSVIERDVIGWTRDPAKTCDYVIWYWTDTGRYYILPFPPLCHVFQRRWEEWRGKYRCAIQHSERNRWDGDEWHGECVFVPRLVVECAVVEWFSGVNQPQPKQPPKQAVLPGLLEPPACPF